MLFFPPAKRGESFTLPRSLSPCPFSCLSESSVTHVRLKLSINTTAWTNTMLGCSSLQLITHYLTRFDHPTAPFSGKISAEDIQQSLPSVLVLAVEVKTLQSYGTLNTSNVLLNNKLSEM